MQPKLQPFFLFALLSCLVNLSGCNTLIKPIEKALPSPSATITQPVIPKEPISKSQLLYQESDSRPPAEEIQLGMQVIESLITTGDNNAAKESIDAINPAELSPLQQNQLNLLYVLTLLNFGEAEQAIEKLILIEPNQLDQENKIKYFQSQAFAFSLTGNLLKSAESRIKLHHLLSEVARPKNQAAILETLNLLPESALQYTQTNELAGWMSLAKLSKFITLPEFSDQLDQWRTTFPEHPADPFLLTQSTDIANSFQQPKSIAILLPESGAFSQAGNAVRAGFLAAHAYAKSSTNLRFYNTNNANVINLYNQALTDGASLIIGPLDKESIQNLANSLSFSISVLALNHVEGLQKDNLYQFALSPIDDAEQITNLAMMDGHRNVLTLIPNNPTGQRVNNYLRKSWENLGGNVLETQTYNIKDTDFTLSIKKLLNIDESDQRYQQIQKTIPLIKYTPRMRQDAQAILLSARSADARSINPQLKFYQTDYLPVYAMPNVYTGEPNPLQDADLNGITFCDIPWFFDKSYSHGDMNMSSLKEKWQKFPHEYFRLFAMGIDAFDISAQLNDIKNRPYSGASGVLSMTGENRVRRNLVCASFINGLPEIINQIKNTTEPLNKNMNLNTNNAY